ncbi:response regulator transcription factor [Anaerofustis stercorihominis]|uniref:Stage 0 sporulation protein A homolog n=2 Tax=Anaerofustis stercorihominis TaxID=214853 RepID=B1C8D8_9FIRM|nr:response regulator transcription factor [Anaerofustis stercorihominis]EDS73275.1 response regulator receiver domain protein [Anaerofustis stercorihominis DSM 17244]MCQ4794566.1 response regulator transcription factor [Anaerofustis stercorihominis]RGD74125.1 DNA-binding response regulator [Anaerofustis stercorihominis]
MQHNILIVEDEKGIRDAIKIYLNNQGYNVFEAENGKEGLEVLNREDIHLAIVDIMMPVMDGITMTMRLRETYDIPVIFLSAKSEDIDKITGLNIGADDYVTKPFASMELIARVNSQIRRYDQILNLKHSSIKEEENSNRYVVGGLELDDDTKEVTVDGNKVKLTAKEYQILRLLIKTPGRVYSSEQIYEQVWNEKAINTETIMVHIRKLREKIEVNPKKPHYIKVVWGIGYKMEKM